MSARRLKQMLESAEYAAVAAVTADPHRSVVASCRMYVGVNMAIGKSEIIMCVDWVQKRCT